MSEHEASRTLVKSPPELWAELSDQSSLASHLAEPFGEIRITRLEPETSVAWEGERASGTVRIEPSGWGTRVTLTARATPIVSSMSTGAPEPVPSEPAPLPRPVPTPEPLPPAAEGPSPAPPASAAPPAPRRGVLGLLRSWLGGKREPSPVEPAAPESERELAPEAAPDAPAGPAPTAQADPTAPQEDPPAAQAPAPVAQAPPPAAQAAMSPVDPAAVLVGVLDRLGAAHRRPFSRT